LLGQQCDATLNACPVKTPVVCPTDKCNIGTCNALTGDCSTAAVNCDDGIDCTVDSCDLVLGCQNIPTDSFCVSSNICANSKCTGTTKGTSGCIETPITGFCSQDVNGTNPFCSDQTCKDFEGCIAIPKNCPNPNDKEECNTYECSEVATKDPDQPIGCQKKERKCANLGAIVGAVVGAGAAVGIALGIAAFIALLAAGGAAIAGATQVGSEDDTNVFTNPIFEAKTATSTGLST
jgi:hypothetical protein